MRSTVQKLKAIREELETQQPLTSLEKWARIIKRQRVAGAPRSIAAAKNVVLLSDYAEDKCIDKKSRVAIHLLIENFKKCAAYRELVWLDQDQLQRFLAEYRANGYRDPPGYAWIENREKNPRREDK